MVALKVPTPAPPDRPPGCRWGTWRRRPRRRPDGSRNSSTISAAGKVLPSSSKSPVSWTWPPLTGTWAMMVLPILACQMRTSQMPSSGIRAGSTSPACRAKRRPRGEVAAVAAPVDEGLVDGDLAVEVVDVMARLAALREDHALAGAGGGAAHPVDIARHRGQGCHHPHEQPVARLAGDPAGFRQVFQAEEHALAGAAAQVGGGDADLGWVGHASSSSAIRIPGAAAAFDSRCRSSADDATRRPSYQGVSPAPSGAGRLQEVLGEALQYAAGFVDGDFLVAVQAAGHRHFEPLPVAPVDDQGRVGARPASAEHVEGLAAVDPQGQASGTRLELQRQHAHADQVGAVDALEALGDDRLHPARRTPLAASRAKNPARSRRRRR